MKKIIYLTLSCVIALSIYQIQKTSVAHSYASIPPPLNSGAPGQSSCNANGCHAVTPNSASGNVQIVSAATDGYASNKTYAMNINISDNTAQRFGFQMVALDGEGNSSGSFIAGSDNKTALQTQAGLQFINHKNTPNPSASTFSFQWLAPGTDTGPITFYAAANAANGNGSSTGDHIYTNSLVLQPKIYTGINNINTTQLAWQVSPNPITDFLQLDIYTASSKNFTLKMVDLQGKLIQEWRNIKANNHFSEKFSVQEAPAGIYFLQLSNGKFAQTQKVVKF
ncbi:MAG: choice-of-anchor V domain-containing protein [Chitinophagales bacterium]|nr:T9SS type A sorting domain-containing protein [Bacteroidota bacterium]